MPSRTQLAVSLAAGGNSLREVVENLLRDELGVSPDLSVLNLRVQEEETPSRVRISISGRESAVLEREQVLALLGSESSLAAALLMQSIFTTVTEDVDLPTLQKQVEDTWAAQPRLSVSGSAPIVVPQVDHLASILASSHSAAVIGHSSSGKTVLCDLLRRRRLDSGETVLWVDLSRPGVSWIGVAVAIASIPQSTSSRPLVVVDDLQGSPQLAGKLLDFWQRLDVMADLLVAGWPDAVPLLEKTIPKQARVRLDGASTVRQIAQSVNAPWAVREEILALAAGDALVADLATDLYQSSTHVGDASEIADLAYQSVTNGLQLDTTQSRALYAISCLATFEIDADPQHLQITIRQGVEELIQQGLLRRRLQYVYLGHKSLARLVIRHFRQRQPDVTVDLAPAAIAVDYLRAAGPEQIKQTLDRLDLVAVSSEKDQFGAAFLAHSWTSLRVLVRYLSQQARLDPTWADNVASAVFAAEAFAALNLHDDWSRTAQFVRGRWSIIQGTDLPVSASETAEADDFKAIFETMREEDVVDPPQEEWRAENIDLDRFHRTWVLGLLLGFEGKALEADPVREQALLSAARDAQLPSGAFYPERVPWVTARVLLGLAALGETVDVSSVAADAARWLRTRKPVGPYSFGVWRPGTGRWNTELQMTAMALLALGRAGTPPSDGSLRRGITYLRDGRAEWYRPGKEIDCAQAIEAALVLGGTWRDFAQEIRSLLSWAQDVNAWSTITAKASEVQDESSKVSAVASALIGIIWETVREELPVLFESVAELSEAAKGESSLEVGWGQSARAAILRCIQRCEEHIKDREALVARGRTSSEVRQALNDWRLLRQQGEDILIQLPEDGRIIHGEDPTALLETVNSFGTSVLKDAWVTIR